ncbi:MAG: DegT/DnrJ/EryC1/StrS family aminotransferase [Candidatus Altiarchaeota archaeon]
MVRPIIPLTKPFFDESELRQIRGALMSGWVSQGPKTREFEGKAAKYLGKKNAVAVTNCTAALHLALLSLGVGKGDEVIVADYTYPATAHAVLYCGAKPVFVDVDERTYNIDPTQVERRITKKTKAIIPVHTFGQPAKIDAVMEIASKHDISVVEDAACAFGAKYKGKYAGTFGDVGCFSFHARKGITTGEGGMVVTDDKKLSDKIRRLSTFGVSGAWSREKDKLFTIPQFTDIGFNYKMSDIAAAVGVAQMRRLKDIINRKQKLAKYWGEKIESIPHITPPFVDKNAEHIYQSYVSTVDESINRNKLITLLMKKGIQTQIGTYSCHIQPVYRSKAVCPVSAGLFNRCLALPMYYKLLEEDIDYAVKHIKKAVEALS